MGGCPLAVYGDAVSSQISFLFLFLVFFFFFFDDEFIDERLGLLLSPTRSTLHLLLSKILKPGRDRLCGIQGCLAQVDAVGIQQCPCKKDIHVRMRKSHHTSKPENNFTYLGIKNLVFVLVPIAENE